MCCPSPIFKPFNLRCVKFDSTLSWLSLTNGVKGDPRRLYRTSIFPSPYLLSSSKFKKAIELPPHRYLPTPTTFHFLPPPYIFAPISPSSLLFNFRPFLPPPYCVPPPLLTCRVGYHTSKPIESVVYCLRLVQYGIDVYLTIIPRARMDSKSIGYWLRGNEGSRNNFFSTIQLVGQKRSRQNNFS